MTSAVIFFSSVDASETGTEIESCVGMSGIVDKPLEEMLAYVRMDTYRYVQSALDE
jgi:hypothetical protein